MTAYAVLRSSDKESIDSFHTSRQSRTTQMGGHQSSGLEFWMGHVKILVFGMAKACMQRREE